MGAFGSLSDLRRHLGSLHFKLKMHKCLQCDASFSEKFKLNVHIKSVHEGIKKLYKSNQHRCSFCNGSFSRPSSLAEHIKSVHENIKDIKCELCNKFFSSVSKAKRHN